MTRHGRHFDEFQPHTRLKHAILDAYVVEWAMKLLMWGRAGDRVAIVDAFAGAGHDDAGNDGSPLIAVRRAREAMDAARGKKPHLDNPKVQVFAIEKEPRRFQKLQETLSPFTRQHPELVRVLPGDLATHIDTILQEVGSCPTFFFLDPFGVKGLNAATYPRMLSGAHNEIFALFSDMGAVRLHGLVSAERPDASADVAAITRAPSLFAHWDAAGISAAEAAAVRANEVLDASVPASRLHLTRALGSEKWVDELAVTPVEQRPDKFVDLFQQALLHAGAHFVLAIPMRNEKSLRVYSLVHASKSRAGFMAMKGCVSAGLRSGTMSEAPRRQMIADLSIDVEQLVSVMRDALAGQSIPWAQEHGGLKALVLGNTPLFDFQLAELKAVLRQRDLLQRVDRKEVCSFPPPGSV